MPDRSRYTFWIDADLQAALTAIKDRTGAPESETIRRILREGLKAELRREKRKETKTSK